MRLIGYYYFAPTLAGLMPPFRMMFTSGELSEIYNNTLESSKKVSCFQ